MDRGIQTRSYRADAMSALKAKDDRDFLNKKSDEGAFKRAAPIQPPSDRVGMKQELQMTTVDNKRPASPGPSSPSPSVSRVSLNAGGGPGQETAGGQTVRNMLDSEYGPLFQKPQVSSLGTDMTPRQPLPYNGAFANGALPNANPAFSGVPTMYPAQQSVGQDIFGDTAELIKRRDTLQSGMDAFFAKNPLGNDLLANFNAIASQAGNRREIKEIGDRLGKRDEIMANLAGIMMQGQNQMNVQGLQNVGQLENTALSGQVQLQNTGLQNQGNANVQNLAGQQRMQQIMAEIFGNKQIVGMQGANQMAVTQAQESGANARNAATIAGNVEAAGAKAPEFYKQQTEIAKALLPLLYGADSNIPEKERAQLQQFLLTMMMGGTGTNQPGPLPGQ